MKPRRTRTTPLLHWVGAAILVVAFVLAVISQPIQFVDDAWISFRYADHLAMRGELTFNRGERVEGISNLLWTVMLAAGRRLAPVRIEHLAAGTALGLAALALYRLWKLGLELRVNPVLSSLAVAFLILIPGVREAMLNGLEGPLFALLLAEASLRLIRRQLSAAALCFGLLFLTRVESLVLGAAMLGLLLRPSIRLKDRLSLSVQLFDLKSAERRAAIARAFAAFLVPVIAGTAFRFLYYGELLPNSVQAKLYPYSGTLVSAGWEYVAEFLQTNPQLLLPPVFSIALLFLKQPAARAEDRAGVIAETESWDLLLRLSLVTVLFSFVVAIRSGGDWMGGFRLLSIYGGVYTSLLLVVLSALSGNPAARWLPSAPDRPTPGGSALRAGAAICALLLVMPLARTVQQAANRLTQGAPVFRVLPTPGFRFWDDTAERLARAPLQSSDVVSSEGIGYLSYVLADSYVHDPLGLTEEHIAKQGKERSPFGKMDLRYTLRDVRPSVMIWHYAGNLRSFQAADLDSAYATFCHGDCKSWSADVVMIRRDRSEELAPYFMDWTPLTFDALYAENS